MDAKMKILNEEGLLPLWLPIYYRKVIKDEALISTYSAHRSNPGSHVGSLSPDAPQLH